MPLYEYECESCQRRFERIQKFSDPLATNCPTCDGPVKKLLSSPAIQFKGSGFYITDYVKSGRPADAEGKEKTEDAAKSEGGGEVAKPDATKSDAAAGKTEGSKSSEPAKSEPAKKKADSAPAPSSKKKPDAG